MHHTRHDTHDTHTHEMMHPKDTLVSISRLVIMCTSSCAPHMTHPNMHHTQHHTHEKMHVNATPHSTSTRIQTRPHYTCKYAPRATQHRSEDAPKRHTTLHIKRRVECEVWSVRSWQVSLNPTSTSNQSSKPCTVLQYPSRDVWSVRSWQVSCVCSHSRLHFVLSVVSSLGMSVCVVLNSYSCMSHVWCSYNSHIEYNTQPMCQHNLLTTQPLNTQPLLIHTLLTHNLRPMVRSSGRAAGGFCPEPPRATRSRQAEVHAARPFPTKH